ncbi:MAG: hypothetical protein H7211_03355 [Aquabacterium sp.]|nr:hypothetical protein [Ferruginibacter sp.]
MQLAIVPVNIFNLIKGIVNFGTGGYTYKILSIPATTVQLRNIGIDENAWYQILKVK